MDLQYRLESWECMCCQIFLPEGAHYHISCLNIVLIQCWEPNKNSQPARGALLILHPWIVSRYKNMHNMCDKSSKEIYTIKDIILNLQFEPFWKCLLCCMWLSALRMTSGCRDTRGICWKVTGKTSRLAAGRTRSNREAESVTQAESVSATPVALFGEEGKDGANISPQVWASTWERRRNSSKLPATVHAWCCWRRSCRTRRRGNVRTYIFLPGHAQSQLPICHQPLAISKRLIVVIGASVKQQSGPGSECQRGS